MAMDQFLELDGIKGESTDKVHKEKIDVLAWSFSGSNSGSAHQGGGAGSGKSSFSDLSITKYIDKSSPVLWKCVSTGEHIPKGTLYVRKAGGKAPIEYWKIEMTECLVTSLSTGGSGGEDRLTENVALNFAKFKVIYQEQKPDGSKEGGEIPFTYDIAGNAPE